MWKEGGGSPVKEGSRNSMKSRMEEKAEGGKRKEEPREEEEEDVGIAQGSKEARDEGTRPGSTRRM